MNLLRSILVAGAVAALVACASPPTREAMTVNTPAAKSYPYSVSVTTGGGAETSALGDVQVSAADLKAVIEKSLIDSKLFQTVVQGNDGDYTLSVMITQLSKPIFGASFTVDLETAWSLTKVTDKKVLLRKVIKTANTATMGDAVVAVTRIRLAIEGAVRKNIEQGIAEIAALGSLD